jgi:peptidoglycan/LPS O-acetylase OafA/YrhL
VLARKSAFPTIKLSLVGGVLFGSRFGYGQWQFCASIAATFAAPGVLSALVEKPGIAFGRDLGQWALAGARVKPAALALPSASLSC